MPRTSTKQQVHRDMNLVTPILRGPDVRELQRSLNGLTDHYEFDWMKVQVDGDEHNGGYGKRTARLTAFCMELTGLEGDLASKARRTGHVSERNQHLLRNPEDRSEADRRREADRRPRFKKLRKDHKEGLAAGVKFMLDHVGVNESPPGSNRGPFPIDECQQWFGLAGVPWCGCAVGYSIEKVAGLGKTGTWWPHAAFIRADAEGGRNGLEDINPNKAVLGNIGTLFNGGDDHVVFIRGEARNGVVPTVEGNTSSATRDSDGGIIEKKERATSEFTCMARLTIN